MDIRFLETVRREKVEDRLASLDKMAALFMFSWIIILLQGAIRKWLLPGFGAAYFIEDIPILMAYGYAVHKGIIWFGGVLYFTVGISLLLCLQALMQVVFIHYNFLAALVALHHYIFYLPMLFLLPACMTRSNIRKFLKLNLLIIIPMTVIALIQSVSARNAWINQTAAGDEIGTAFGVSTTIARTSGTFNFTLPFSIWCGIAAAMVIGEWLLPPARRTLRSRSLLLVISMCIMLATATSGSRTAIFLVTLAILGSIVATLMIGNVMLSVRIAAILVLLPAFGGVAYLIAPGSIDALVGRFTQEGAREEMSSRVVTMTIGFLLYPDFDVLGHGIGMGIPAAEASARFVQNDPYWRVGSAYISEWDNIRAVQSLGNIVGSIVVFARYGAGVLLLIAAFRALLLPIGQSWPHAIPLAFTLLPTLMIGDMVHSAPIDAPQMYYCTAIILSSFLYRQESFSTRKFSQLETR